MGSTTSQQKLRQLTDHDGALVGYLVSCPACRGFHAFYTERPNQIGARWTFDGNLESPTFNPSMLVAISETPGYPAVRCHSFVRAGRIEFLPDCTHALAGQTVDLPPVDL